MLTIDRPKLTIRKANGDKINTIYNATNILESLNFGEINNLTFDVPYYLLDANGNAILNDDGTYIKNQKVDILIAEYIVEIEDRVYIIKLPSEKKDRDGVKSINVVCEEMASDLGFKQVKYLNLYPPYTNPVDPQRAILEIITYPYQQDLGYGNFTLVSGTSLTLGVTTTFDFTGYYIAILDGTGKYQQRKIISYSTSTKIAVVDSLFSPQVDLTSIFRIHNSRFLLGDVASEILIVDGSPVFRSLVFEDTTVQDALQTTRARFGGSLIYSTARDDVENKYFVTVGLKNNNGVSGYEFRYKKNLNGITRTVDSTNSCYTRVYPEGRNNLSIVDVATKSRTDSSITYDSHTLGKGDIYNFQYYLGLGYTLDECYELFVKDFRFIEDAYVDSDDLYVGASQALNDLSVPRIEYRIEGIDFSKLDLPIFNGVNIIDLVEGDIVRVVDNELGFDFNATVVKIKRNYNEPYKPTIDLSNFTDTLGDIYAKIIKYQEGYSERKSLYGKSATVVLADKATSRNWRYADYVVPDDGSKTADEILQFAIDEISANNGGDIYVAEGDYGFATQVNLKDNVNIYGYGVATRIYPIGSPSLAFNNSSADNTSINDLLIDYNRDIDGITAISYFSNAVGIYSNSDSVTVSNCTIERVSNNYIIAIECSNVAIINNTLQSLNTEFIGSDVIDLKACSNADVFKNRILGLIGGFRIINIVNQVGVSSGEFFVQDNYIRTSEAVVWGIYVDVDQDAYVSIGNNTIISTGLDGRFSDVFRILGTKDFDVYDNVVHAVVSESCMTIYGQTGIEQTGNVRNNSFNTSRTVSQQVNVVGIYLRERSNKIMVQNNKVTGLNIYSPTLTTALTHGCRIETNTCLNNTISANDFSINTTTSYQDLGIGTLTLGGNRL